MTIRLRITLLLITFFPAALHAQQPRIGFLRIYNCMSQEAQFIPVLDSQALAAIPMKSGEKVSGMYFRAGKYDLKLDSKDFKLDAIQVDIKENQTVTAVALHVYNAQKKALEPRLVALSEKFSPVTEQGNLPLRLRSFSRNDLFLDLGFDKIFLRSMESQGYGGWNGAAFLLKIKNARIGVMEAEGRVEHTLVVWDIDEKRKNAALIPNIKYAPPLGLREDLSYGKKREDFKNLKTLKPRKKQ